MRLAIVSGGLVLLLVLGACEQYRESRRTEDEAKMETAQKVRIEQGDSAADHLHAPKTHEQVVEVPALPSTPTPTPGLLNRPVDPAGEPHN